MKPLRLIATALAALLFLAACTKRETAVEAGIRTQTLIVGNALEPATLDPALCEIIPAQKIVLSIYEGLTWFDARTSQPVPAAAERWEMSPDGLSWTFYLRPNARWANGDPVTAHDFVFSFRRTLSPKLASGIAHFLFPLKNAKAFNAGQLKGASAVGAEAVDDCTLRLTLEYPAPYLSALVASPYLMPVHRPSIEQCGTIEDRTSPWARPGKLVGNGPFVLAEWRPHNRVVVRRNPQYWDAARNGLEEIVFLPTESPDVDERNFRAGQVHVTYTVPPAKIARYREREPAKLRHDPLLDSGYLMFNVRHRLLGDPRVRRALSLAIDREAIVAAVFFGSRQSATHYTPPDCGGYTTRARVPTDFAAARRLLAEAGFPGGKGLTGLEILAMSAGEWPRLCEVIQEMWRRELGVQVGVAPVEAKTLIQNLDKGNFSIATYNFAADFPDPANFLEDFVTGRNGTKWDNPVYDRLIAEAARTLEPSRRFELFQQAETLLLDQAPIAPLDFRSQNYLIHPAVKNWKPSMLYFQRYQDVRLEK